MNGDYNQHMVRRVLKAIFLLSDTKSGYSVKYLSEVLGVSQRAVYRYLNLFNDLGFELEKCHNKYKIINFKQTTNGNNQKGLLS